MTNREKAVRLARRGQFLTVLALIGLAGVYVRALVYTPVERLQGPAQKILYLHVPSAILALTAFVVCGLLSILYLGLKDERVDRLASSSAEVGMALSVVMLSTGPMWGRPVWGTWWTWDARLTFTLFLFLLFSGYLILRQGVLDRGQRARFSAVLGIMGLVLVPFIHLTVYMFPTLHPKPVLIKPSAPNMPGSMLTTLLFSIGVFALLYLGLVIQRYALSHMQLLREEEVFGDT